MRPLSSGHAPHRGATPRKGLAGAGAMLHQPNGPAELLRGAPHGAGPWKIGLRAGGTELAGARTCLRTGSQRGNLLTAVMGPLLIPATVSRVSVGAPRDTCN